MDPVLANPTVWPLLDSGAPILVVVSMGLEASVVAAFQQPEHRDRCVVHVLAANLVSALAGFAVLSVLRGGLIEHWARGLRYFPGPLLEGYPASKARALNPVGWFAFDHPVLVLALIGVAAILIEYPVLRLLRRSPMYRRLLLATVFGNIASHAVLVWWAVRIWR